MDPEDWTPERHPRYAKTAAVLRYVRHNHRPVGKNFFDNWNKTRVLRLNGYRLFDVAELIAFFTAQTQELESQWPRDDAR